MIYFLGVQSTYTAIEVGVFAQEKLVTCAQEDKIRASKNLIPLIAYTLDQAKIPLEKLSFIAVNQGPGPFTTLRVAIATANGLSFASKLPLIGIDSLEAFLREHAPKKQVTLVLFNAFNNDVYYALQSPGIAPRTGYKNIEVLLSQIHQEMPEQSVVFLGNGTELHREKITQLLGTHAIIPEPLATTYSIQKLGALALERWQKKEGLSTQLTPLYLKQAL
ncbi:tRNA (adenosine(37)-N6)-threonylcarbamoyltransferase complex dimerization subunit type 1 TsaB [Candidatus Dependentiae bacterium HGW-Dependentiae-1]|nr:MAG: tRNA (adenosine(37)-N6)-threonylcarbamoyltransferase complex dimerization subunit type 1 TsaB [Candidatus Dependentiae bacterium HGW-Dependentiae-1]